MADYETLLRVAAGDEPADLVIRDVTLLNVVTREVYPATIGVCDDTIAYVTSPDDPKCAGRQVIEGRGLWAAPGLIDSHMHIESTHVTPPFFAAAIVPRGVTTVAQDPHEMANVIGTAGVDYLREASRGLPLRVLTFVSTCVPAVPGLETSGAAFDAAEVNALLDKPDTIGLAEVMDYWGVIRRSPRMNRIVQAGRARKAILTGHIRIQGQRELNTYLAAGIDSDHEFLTPEGILARSRLGMTIEICCTRNRDNIPAAVESWRQRGHIENVAFVTDDMPPQELVKEGHLDRGVRRAIQLGMAPVDAVRAATLVPARRLRRYDLGQIAPGRTADILLISDLSQFTVSQVISNGRLVAADGRMLVELRAGVPVPPQARHSVHLEPFSAADFAVPAQGRQVTAHVLTARARGPLQDVPLLVEAGQVAWQAHPDLALVSVWHRHGLNHNHSFTLIAGTGLRAGALATTYAHDSHNLLVLGRDPADMAAAANALRECGGGYAAVSSGQVCALAALPVAGMLAECAVDELSGDFEAFERAAADLGVAENPLGLLTSLPLPVVPRFRPTDMGLVDVEQQKLVPAFEA
jgi:adenine deaminase